jgi:hypothetical protein
MAKEYVSFTSEKGIAMWSKVNTVIDIFEQADGSTKETGFVINVYFDDEYAEKLKKDAADAIVEAKQSGEYVNKKTGKPLVWRENPRVPYKVDENEDSQMFGKTYFSFKTSHLKKDKSDQLVKKLVPLFDEFGKPMEPMTAIGNNSIVKVNYSPSVYYISTEQNGVKFFLNAIQVIDLNPVGGGSGSAGFGFGVEAPANPMFPVEDQEIPF